MRYGIFGGTFDPPHVGHLILAMEAYYQLSLDKVLWVIAPKPPHKIGKKITSIDIRIEMVRKAINEDSMFQLSRVDIDRPGPHFVLDTMKILHKKYINDELVFILGGDSLKDLHSWYQPDEFVDECDEIGVMRRPGEQFDLSKIEKRVPGIKGKVKFIDAPLLEISSKKIRKLAKKDQPFRYYLCSEVFKIIDEKGLYKANKNDTEKTTKA